MYLSLAAVETAGAVGLILGIWVPWIGVSAAIGVVLHSCCGSSPTER